MKMNKSNVFFVFLCVFVLSACDTNSQTTIAQYPEQQSQGFKVFSKQCSSCHRPPMPSTHTAHEWEMVLFRMQKHRQQRGLTVLNEIEKKDILAYLKRHSQQEKP